MHLLPHVSYDTQETLLSYAGRLAAIHTGQPMHRLLSDLNIKIDDFTLGREDAVARFADATGADPEELSRANLRAVQSEVSFRGERCYKTFLARAADKYCPLCLAEDGQPRDWRQRLLWCFAPVHRCSRHGVFLSRLDAPERTLQEGLERPVPSDAHHAPGSFPAYLLWLETRLHGDGAREPLWLAGQGIQQVLDASLMLGTVIEEGHRVSARKLPPARQEVALERGFSFYAGGPDRVAEALDLIRATSPAQAVQAGPLAHYGKLFEWLDQKCNGRDPGPIRDLLRNHIIEHDAVDVGEMILGKATEKRHFHSVQSLSASLGINRERMARLLQKLGRIPAGATDAEVGVLRFDAQDVSALIADFETAIPLADVPDYIGASLSQMQALYAAGVIEPLVPRNAPGAVRQVVFARRSLDEFLEALARLPEAGPQIDLQSIGYACQRGAGTTVEVVTAILADHVPAFRLPDKHGLAAVVLSPTEAMAARAA